MCHICGHTFADEKNLTHVKKHSEEEENKANILSNIDNALHKKKPASATVSKPPAEESEETPGAQESEETPGAQESEETSAAQEAETPGVTHAIVHSAQETGESAPLQDTLETVPSQQDELPGLDLPSLPEERNIFSEAYLDSIIQQNPDFQQSSTDTELE